MKQFTLSNSLFVLGSKALRFLGLLISLFCLFGLAQPVYAGGGGENMLLIVNPNDEPSLRIANAYVQARHIPVNNILYIAPLNAGGFTYHTIWNTEFTATYQSVIPAAIAARGLTGQIDYLGTLGQPHRVDVGYGIPLSFENCLNQLTQFQNGMPMATVNNRASEVHLASGFPLQESSSTGPFNYVHGANAAIHHSTHYPPAAADTTGTVSYAQWYLSGVIGYAGLYGLTPTQVIQNLQRTVGGDGLKPNGTLYFEMTGDGLRTGARAGQWPVVQPYLTAQGIPWIEESISNGYTATPWNRKDVGWVAIGSSVYRQPAGSIYLPGSWADSLTSTGGDYSRAEGQTLSNMNLLAGAGGSSGTVSEPTAMAKRFPNAILPIWSRDGATMGESFYSSMYQPDMIQVQGDLLSQPYADIPAVTLTSAPADGSVVSGTIALTGTAVLPNLTSQSTATGIASLRLFVDGRDSGIAVAGATGTVALDTTVLTDGQHEARLVAYNNSAAASEGCVIRNYQVNNHGESVEVTSGSSYRLAASGTQSIAVFASQGSGPAIIGIQLQSLGRVVGSTGGLSGNITLSGTSLAYGNNTVTPVALLSNGGQVQGVAVTVNRQFQPLPGISPTPLANQNPGFDFSFFKGIAQKSIAATNFNGTPTDVRHGIALSMIPNGSSYPYLINMPDAYRTTVGGSNVGLGVMIKGSFTVTAPGEYSFGYAIDNILWSSVSVEVDGITLSNFDCWKGAVFNPFAHPADTCRSAYLLPGEHTLRVKLANLPSNGMNTPDANMSFSLCFRQPDANFRGDGMALSYSTNNTTGVASAPYFYTVKKSGGH